MRVFYVKFKILDAKARPNPISDVRAAIDGETAAVDIAEGAGEQKAEVEQCKNTIDDFVGQIDDLTSISDSMNDLAHQMNEENEQGKNIIIELKDSQNRNIP